MERGGFIRKLNVSAVDISGEQYFISVDRDLRLNIILVPDPMCLLVGRALENAYIANTK